MNITLSEIPLNKTFFCKDVFGQKRRAIREEGKKVFVFMKRSKKYGKRMDETSFLSSYTLCERRPVDENAKWHRHIIRAKSALKISGLWPELLDYLQDLEKMTWNDKKSIDELYWKNRDYESEEWQKWFHKYPFMEGIAEDGTHFPNTEYFWEKSNVILEPMYFGKYRNLSVKKEIQNALERKTPFDRRYEAESYDRSFIYRPEKNKAWYSKEYRGCGNGYYYLAIDGNTAWFLEKD